ncbi:MAG: hypothetical protein KHZ58_11690 [Hungatella hathewayi]|nr:hypothetical protein [Hungatella hathewayi]
MEVTAKYRCGKYVLCDEQGNCLAQVQKVHGKSGQMRVLDGAGEMAYDVVKDGDRIAVSGRDAGGSAAGAAGQERDGRGKENCSMDGRILYEHDEAGNILQPSLFRPPMAEELLLETPWGQLKIVQDKKREFEVYLEEKKAGAMSHMLSFQKKMTMTSEGLPKEIYGMILGLGMFMLREDDVEVV